MISGKLTVLEGDITQLQGDAMINAANTSLLRDGGVDRMCIGSRVRIIRRMPMFKWLSNRRCQNQNLPADWVIHTVGPVWQDGNQGEAEVGGN
ncbi:MAG TPA: hypothetical protein V6D11_21250 [Waterburya sp.]|jgi:O-acetyl-ADP-ribose deacetylase (regulator of RNase III)